MVKKQTKIYSVEQLQKIVGLMRIETIKMLVYADSGHTASPLGLADFFTAMYFKILNHNPLKPNWSKRDRLILSAGHVVPIRYVAMAYAGYFPKKELYTLRRINSRLQGHPSVVDIPALETSSGPLGQGSSIAVGRALAAKMKKEKHYIYLLMSDAEQQEGQTWEAVMSAAKYKLNKLIAFIDQNNIQISGTTSEIMPVENLAKKYQAFGWNVLKTDGNNIKNLIETIRIAKKEKSKPTAIIMKTIPGKGVSFMENNPEWHGKVPNKDQAIKALNELEAI